MRMRYSQSISSAWPISTTVYPGKANWFCSFNILLYSKISLKQAYLHANCHLVPQKASPLQSIPPCTIATQPGYTVSRHTCTSASPPKRSKCAIALSPKVTMQKAYSPVDKVSLDVTGCAQVEQIWVTHTSHINPNPLLSSVKNVRQPGWSTLSFSSKFSVSCIETNVVETTKRTETNIYHSCKACATASIMTSIWSISDFARYILIGASKMSLPDCHFHLLQLPRPNATHSMQHREDLSHESSWCLCFSLFILQRHHTKYERVDLHELWS